MRSMAAQLLEPLCSLCAQKLANFQHQLQQLQSQPADQAYHERSQQLVQCRIDSAHSQVVLELKLDLLPECVRKAASRAQTRYVIRAENYHALRCRLQQRCCPCAVDKNSDVPVVLASSAPCCCGRTARHAQHMRSACPDECRAACGLCYHALETSCNHCMTCEAGTMHENLQIWRLLHRYHAVFGPSGASLSAHPAASSTLIDAHERVRVDSAPRGGCRGIGGVCVV